MNIYEFKGIKEDDQLTGMDKLEAAFKPITKEQWDVYFDRLRLLSMELFYRAVDYIIDTHKDKGFPKVAEILEASSQAGKELPGGLPDYSGIKCNMCNDIGYILTLHANSQPSACPCGCKLGEKIKQGWISSFKRSKKKN